MEETIPTKNFLSIKEFAAYTGLGATKIRKMIRDPTCNYSVKIGGQWFVLKDEFDRTAKRNAKFNIAM